MKTLWKKRLKETFNLTYLKHFPVVKNSSRKDIFIKKLVATAIATVILVATIGGSTYAYFKSSPAKKENTITIGSITTQIEEDVEIDDQSIKKNPSVKNLGANDCYIRMRVLVSPESQANNLNFSYDNTNWKLEEDGFYYYNNPVKPKESTTPLFQEITIKNKGALEDFEVNLYQEAIQTEAYDFTNNEKITGKDKLWELYD